MGRRTATKQPPKTTRSGTVPVTYDTSRNKWIVTWYVAGKRKRKSFEQKSDADKHWDTIAKTKEREGKEALRFDRDAFEEWRAAKDMADGEDLREIVREWIEQRKRRCERKNADEAIAEYLVHKKQLNRSDKHLKDISLRLKTFAESFGLRDVGNITASEITDWLMGLKPKTKKRKKLSSRTIRNYQLIVSSFFNWCERKGWLDYNPADQIHESDLPTVPRGIKGVFSVDECAGLMGWLEEHWPHKCALVALQLFAGIRTEETRRWRWEWVDFERKQIVLPGWVIDGGQITPGTKTRDDWVMMDLPDNLWIWIEQYKDVTKSQRSQWITDHNRQHLIKKNAITHWPHNALRHTFCTMHISLHQDAAKTALLLRHQSPAQLHRSYLGKMVSREEAEKFFAIMPNK